MTDLQVRQGYANGTLTDCDECGATMKNGGECPVCSDSCDDEQQEDHEDTDSLEDHGITLGSYAS